MLKRLNIKKGIRRTSTPLSADRGEVSVLAIAETLAATSISLFIAWYWNTLLHIAISASLAPLLLLRTRRSTMLGLKYAETYFNILNHSEKSRDTWHGLVILLMPVFMLFIKIAAIIVGFLRSPIASLEAIPFNWKRVVLCVDIYYPPELLTGAERLRRNFNNNPPAFKETNDNFRDSFLSGIKDSAGFPQVLIVPFLLLFSGLIFLIIVYGSYLLSMTYRWSLKSTALIWSPLLWVVISARGTGMPKIDLSYIRDWQLYKVMRAYSLFVIAVFAAKMWLFFNLENAVHAANGWLQIRGIQLYVSPHVLPSWQLAAVLNAAIAWGLLFFAQRQLAAISMDDPSRLSDSTVRWILSTSSVIRNLLSFWVIFCTLWLAWQLEWPEFKVQYLPW
jgi:hypothetical protein